MNTLENLLSWKPIADKKRSIPAFVRERDFMAISAIFSDVDGNKIKKRRNELTTIITAESIKGEDFWYFLESLLIIDSLRYRKPISDAVQEIKDISQYAATEDAITRVVRRMLADEGKVHQALGLMSKFKTMLPEEALMLLRKSFCKLTDVEQIKSALDIMGCINLEDKLEILATNDSLASIYLGIEYIYTFRNTKLYMLKMKDYPYIWRYLSHMHGSFVRCLANDLIMKTSFGDNSKLNDREVSNYLLGGFSTFEKGILRHETAVNRKAMSKEIKTMLGEEVTCCVNYIGPNYVIVGTNRGYAGILPNLFTTKEFHSIPNKERFIAKVVRVLQKDQYLIVSQKDVRKEDVQRFTLTTKGELVEVRFRRSGATFVPNILGHGPVRATVVFPKRFDYKQKYQAQVTRVIDICNCEIRLLHPIVTSKQKGQ